ncbi:DMT family transporter [Zophobihabitans entericus]|uniref:EamA family transporter n=1 Tax=Zophobihabitans entericus TaxID=1635327 RepID=A0A6G9IE95_9GAMM|nr:EamA family transporter [Zophobihabitans entericus]QIQ22014.1 EamA family transporter [Zophobihabitans entericus]
MNLSTNLNYGFIAVLVASFLWGTTGTVASFAPDLSPLTIGAAAMGGGGLLQALLARKNIRQCFMAIQYNIKIILIGALSVGIYPLAFYSSMYYAGITIGTVVTIGAAPLFSAILEMLFDKKPLSISWLISFIFGITGVIFLSLGESHEAALPQELITDNKLLGILLGLLAALTYALYSWIAKKLIDRGIDSKASLGIIFGLGAIILLPTLFFTGTNLFTESINVIVVGYMMLIPMFLGYVLFGYGLKKVPTSQAVTLTLFEPFVAALLAMTLVGEQLAMIGWVGMIFIFICLIILSKSN